MLRWLFLLLGCTLFAGEHPTLCLCMIVKDEKEAILDCLSSVKPIIDSWVIVDTGSTDGTQQIIKDFLKDIPGELYERPWVNFSHNRNEAMALAKTKGDYSLILDADERLLFSPSFTLPKLDLDYYYFTIDVGLLQFHRISIINNQFQWAYRGVIHEILESPDAKKYDRLPGVVNLATSKNGGRSRDANKFEKDIETLNRALKEEPDNPRYLIHLANTYTCLKKYELAMETYQKYVKTSTFDQEVFFSMLEIGKLQQALGKEPKVFLKSILDAYFFRPSRIEPLFYLVKYYLSQKNYLKAYTYSKKAIAMPMTSDGSLIEGWIYDWGMLYSFIESCYHLQQFDEMALAMKKLLLAQNLPEHIREETKQNLAHLSTNKE